MLWSSATCCLPRRAPPGREGAGRSQDDDPAASRRTLAQYVARPAERVDEPRLPRRLELQAEMPHVHLKDVVVAAEVVAPHLLGEVLLLEDLPGMPQELAQEG